MHLPNGRLRNAPTSGRWGRRRRGRGKNALNSSAEKHVEGTSLPDNSEVGGRIREAFSRARVGSETFPSAFVSYGGDTSLCFCSTYRLPTSFPVLPGQRALINSNMVDGQSAPVETTTEPAPPALPDYVLSPNAVFNDDGVQWRYGRAPDYSKTRKVWEEGEHI